VGNGEEDAIRGSLLVARSVGSEIERFGEGKNGLVLHDASEAVVILVLKCSGTREAISQDSRCSTLVAYILLQWLVSRCGSPSMANTHRRTSESQASPFSTITPLGEQKLISSLDDPALELFRLGIFEFPYYLATSVSTDPLAVEVDVDVDVEVSRGMDT
jgi:hypothetical protein